MKNKTLILGCIGVVIVLFFVYILFIKEEVAYETYDINSPVIVGEVHLIVSDLEQSVEFYTELIGFDILADEPNKVTLTADGRTSLLVLETMKGSVERPLGTTGLYHFAILLPDRSSLANTLLHLAASEYLMQGAANHQYSDALYLAAPDGNGIEIYVDLPPENWKRDKDGGYVGGSYPIDFEKLIEVASPPWTGLPENTRIGHMHLQVAELDNSEQFYVNGLDFDITKKDNGSLFLSRDHYHHHIAMNTWSGTSLPAPPDNARGLNKFTLVFTQQELDEAKLQLKHLGFPFAENKHSIIVTDPSSNVIEITTN
ncbi:VOC family protein [Sporosarcina soli]|uniref:VOC family protein n=1 Tax=Sporosarcina soli TaxID=334736 RepID=A0ABW0TM59_9BACL